MSVCWVFKMIPDWVIDFAEDRPGESCIQLRIVLCLRSCVKEGEKSEKSVGKVSSSHNSYLSILLLLLLDFETTSIHSTIKRLSHEYSSCSTRWLVWRLLAKPKVSRADDCQLSQNVLSTRIPYCVDPCQRVFCCLLK